MVTIIKAVSLSLYYTSLATALPASYGPSQTNTATSVDTVGNPGSTVPGPHAHAPTFWKIMSMDFTVLTMSSSTRMAPQAASEFLPVPTMDLTPMMPPPMLPMPSLSVPSGYPTPYPMPPYNPVESGTKKITKRHDGSGHEHNGHNLRGVNPEDTIATGQPMPTVGLEADEVKTKTRVSPRFPGSGPDFKLPEFKGPQLRDGFKILPVPSPKSASVFTNSISPRSPPHAERERLWYHRMLHRLKDFFRSRHSRHNHEELPVSPPNPPKSARPIKRSLFDGFPFGNLGKNFGGPLQPVAAAKRDLQITDMVREHGRNFLRSAMDKGVMGQGLQSRDHVAASGEGEVVEAKTTGCHWTGLWWVDCRKDRCPDSRCVKKPHV